MNKETVTVIILEGGKTCREVNPLLESPDVFYVLNEDIQEAERKLRTWEIEFYQDGKYIYEGVDFIENLIHKAQIINGKAVIV